MAAQLKFYSDTNEIGGGSGLGFYGSSFGNSVRVGEYQQTTYITNAAGTAQGPQTDNIKFHNMGSGYVNSATDPTGLRRIPNADATMNIRFTNDTPVNVQAVELRIYDRISVSNPASGVTTYVVEHIHPDGSQAGPLGSGGATWTVFSGISSATGFLTLAKNPGVSGLQAGNGLNGGATSSRHDWYVSLSASPDSIGSKSSYGLYVSLEYL